MRKNYKEKIKMYSALAGGIVLAANNEGNAQVVYNDFQDIVINSGGRYSYNSYPLDLNSDGITDFQLNIGTYYTTYFSINASVSGNALQNSTVYPTWTVGKLNFNDEIGHNHSIGASYMGSITYGSFRGGVTDKYVGVRFNVNSVTYYGWMRLDVKADFSQIVIKDFAYESSPNALIKAGATSSVPPVVALFAFDGGNAGDASDIHVSFTKAGNETNINNYRIFVAPANSGFNLDTAQNYIITGRYFDVAKAGVYFNLTLPSTMSDVYGNSIVPGTAYKVFAVSVANAGYDDGFAASNSSVKTVITAVEETSDLTSNITYFNNTLLLNNMPAEGTVEMYSVSGLKVYNSNVSVGDNKYNVATSNTGIYLVKVLLSDRVITRKIFVE